MTCSAHEQMLESSNLKTFFMFFENKLQFQFLCKAMIIIRSLMKHLLQRKCLLYKDNGVYRKVTKSGPLEYNMRAKGKPALQR
jgi:hypothetical protein